MSLLVRNPCGFVVLAFWLELFGFFTNALESVWRFAICHSFEANGSDLPTAVDFI